MDTIERIDFGDYIYRMRFTAKASKDFRDWLGDRIQGKRSAGQWGYLYRQYISHKQDKKRRENRQWK